MSKSACHKSTLGVAFVILMTLSGHDCFAQRAGDLLIAPTRVVIEGTKRNETLGLTNTGSDTATYQVSLTRLQMNSDGHLAPVTASDTNQLYADECIRIFPKQIILAPHETQNLRIQLVNASDLQDGEYRSHLYFRAITDPRTNNRKLAATDTGVSVKLIPIFGISLPVIVRRGHLSASVEVMDIGIKRDSLNPRDSSGNARMFASVWFHRTGNQSVYGTITVRHRALDGAEILLGTISGIAIYTPLESRLVNIPIIVPGGEQLADGIISVDYLESGQARKGMIAHGESSFSKTFSTR